MDIQTIKQRFGIIGNSPLLERAIDVARQVAPTDISVLITGESGTGKEFFPKIIHNLSARKHGPYIAVNCGAIPEGTIDSELFGHEKGSFTGAHDARKGYFEVVEGGTIFLDEVAEMPLSTQARLLRVLETGEFIRVGSSKVLKTNVRVIAATNVNMPEAISENRFRQDLYYRLSTVPIYVPPLRERKEDIHLLFRKFAADFAEKYRMPPIQLTEEAVKMLTQYEWNGNIRQLKNVTEQISIIEQNRLISGQVILKYLPQEHISRVPALFQSGRSKEDFSERDLLYKVLFDMRRDINDLKNIVFGLKHEEEVQAAEPIPASNSRLININKSDTYDVPIFEDENAEPEEIEYQPVLSEISPGETTEESLSIQQKEADLIRRALRKHQGNRRLAAEELEISERTLYRKIKEYHINL